MGVAGAIIPVGAEAGASTPLHRGTLAASCSLASKPCAPSSPDRRGRRRNAVRIVCVRAAGPLPARGSPSRYVAWAIEISSRRNGDDAVSSLELRASRDRVEQWLHDVLSPASWTYRSCTWGGTADHPESRREIARRAPRMQSRARASAAPRPESGNRPRLPAAPSASALLASGISDNAWLPARGIAALKRSTKTRRDLALLIPLSFSSVD